MKIMAFNGSPRRNGNTANLLKEALRGAAAAGADTKYVDLYTLNFKGCISCFYCKRKDKEHGTCIVKDDLAPLLTEIKEADALIFGTPIYFMSITSGMQAFLERLFFSNYIYSAEIPSVFGKKIPSAFIYTMNVTEEQAKEYNLAQNLAAQEGFTDRILGLPPKTLWAYDTLQFNDYSKYESSIFSESDKKAYQEKAGPICLKQAYDIGQSLVQDTTK
ncbi:flavodoxin family protein [uncultured Megasphaera sp.]|uniref:flavodoxin family protein n=1 Tax=uncultured Megasphaera sp. TaxID=165188 RepID=UPI0025E2C0E8|nr:flavodoxin family protein [uncultured Megasphaera sp.]